MGPAASGRRNAHRGRSWARPQVPLTEGDEAGELDDGASAKMMRLEPEELQEGTEEGARRQPNPRSKCMRKTTRSCPSGRGLCSPRGRRTPTSVSRGRRRVARSWVMSSEVTFEPIQEPDGSDMMEGRRRKMDGEGVLLGAAGAAVRQLQRVEREQRDRRA